MRVYVDDGPYRNKGPYGWGSVLFLLTLLGLIGKYWLKLF